MIKVALVRGRYLNNFEGQNYSFFSRKLKITGISSLSPLDEKVNFPVIKLPSFSDWQKYSFLDKPIKFLSNRIIGDSQVLFGLEKFASQFDIFHTADPYYYYSYQLAKLRLRNLISCLLMTSWETIPFNNESVYQRKRIKKISLKAVDGFICYTEKARNVLITEGINQNKINLVRLGVDLERFQPKKRLKNQLTILFVGRLVEEKGIKDLLEMFYQVKKQTRLSKLKLKIVGDGKLKKQLELFIKEKKLTNDVFLLKKDYSQIHQDYQQADLFVLPTKKTNTWEEQYGMVLIEAMASGLPAIVYDSGAVKEIIGEAGILVKKNNYQQLVKQIIFLINNDRERIKLGKIARRRAEKYFDAKKTAKALEEIYLKYYENFCRNSHKK